MAALTDTELTGTPPTGTDRCPCGAGQYAACCGPLHAGAVATTAVALMRSRYAAFALGIEPYLLTTWHPSTRPETIDLTGGTVWRRLQIVETTRGSAEDETGVVEFRASYRTPDGVGILHERSRFIRVEGCWRYIDGDILT